MKLGEILFRKGFCYLCVVLCCAVLCLVAQSCPNLCDPIDCSPSGSSVHGDSPGKNTGVSIPPCFPPESSQPRSPALQMDSFTV